MIGWLRRDAAKVPARPVALRTLTVAGRELPLRISTLCSARRMTLRLAPDGSEARITLPPWGGLGEAQAFAQDRSEWLAGQLARLPRPEPIQAGGMLPYRGTPVRIEWQATAPRRPVLDGGAIIVGGPQAALETRLRRWLETEALRLFAADAADYAARAALPGPPVLLSRAQRRWGSCTKDGVVRLNWRLVMAPDAVRRSVVAHEIAHLQHFDHGPGFHACLARLYEDDLAAANRWLRRQGRALYAPFG